MILSFNTKIYPIKMNRRLQQRRHKARQNSIRKSGITWNIIFLGSGKLSHPILEVGVKNWSWEEGLDTQVIA